MRSKAESAAPGGIGFRELLFLTDFSETSAQALPYAAAIARSFASTLCVLHVIPASEYSHVAEEERPRVQAAMRAEAEKQITQLLAAAHFQGIRHNVLLEHGDILSVLTATAERRHSDLIVLGLHGRHGIQKMLAGSMAEEVLRLGRIPVLAVGPEVNVDPRAEVNPRRILGVVDVAGSGDAVHYAGALARRWHAHLVLLHIVQDVWAESLSTRMPQEAFFRLRLLEKGWMTEIDDLASELRIDFGSLEERVLEAEARDRPDLMVLEIPAAEHPVLEAHLPGPPAYNILSHAHCPVLVLRRGTEPGPATPP